MATRSQASSSEIEDFKDECETLSATVKEMFCNGGSYLVGEVSV